MIPVRIRSDFKERLKEVYPHLQDNFLGFQNLQRHVCENVYVKDFDLSLVGEIYNVRGEALIRGSKMGVAIQHLVKDKTFKDYL